jgi:MFS family permease
MRQTGSDWGLSETSQSFIAIALGLGVFMGALGSGYLIDRIGRMFMFKKTLFIAGSCGLVASFSMNLVMLSLLFFGVGLGMGKP